MSLPREEVQLTSETEADVIIQHGRLPHGPGVLQLQHTLLLHGEDNAVLAAHSDRASTLANGLEGVVDLEEVAICASRRKRCS